MIKVNIFSDLEMEEHAAKESEKIIEKFKYNSPTMEKFKSDTMLIQYN